jgi:soluble lytic murein transglycosylase-like protein
MKQKTILIELKISIIVIFILLCIGGYFYSSYKIKNARVDFYKQYADESVAIAEIHSADYYELDWLLCMANTKAESGFKIMAKSTFHRKGKRYHAYGLKQLVMSTAAYCRSALGDRFKDSTIYAVDFNVWAGNLHFKNVLENYSSNNILKAIEIYNVGHGAFRRGKTEGVNRNSRHVKKVTIYYQELKEQWKKFKKW